MPMTRLPHFFSVIAGFVALLLLPAQVQAQFSEVGYSASGTGDYVFWEDQAGLTDGFFVGGKLGLSFGEYLQLQGLYLRSLDMETDFSGFSGNDPDVLDALRAQQGREVELERFGAQLKASLGTGTTRPFLQLGTGVLRIDPQPRDGAGTIERTESIYADAGLGLIFPIGQNAQLSVVGQGLAYRYNPGTALLSDEDIDAINAELDPDDAITRGVFQQQTVFNPSVSASLSLRLGGRAAGERTAADEGVRTLFDDMRLSVEPFYGRISFNDALDFPAGQSIGGVNLGLDVTPLIGLRAFYWRATDAGEVPGGAVSDWFQRMQMVGGELELRLDSDIGRGITPYVNLGGGYVDVLSGFEGRDGGPVESRYFAMGGGGLDVPLNQRISFRGGVRALLMSTQDIGDVSSPSNVYVSPAFTAGVVFNVGRDRDEITERPREDVRAEVRDEVVDEVEDEAAQEIARLRAEVDSLRQIDEERQQAIAEARARALEEGRDPDEAARRVAEDMEEAPEERVREEEIRERIVREEVPRRSNLSDRIIEVPVPEEGEIYLRYGRGEVDAPAAAAPAAGLTSDQVRRIVREVVDERIAEAGGISQEQARQLAREALREELGDVAVTREDVDRQVRDAVSQRLQDVEDGTLSIAELQRLETRLERLDDRLSREMSRVRSEGLAPRPTTVVEQPDRVVRERRGGITRPFGRGLTGVQPMTGFRTGDGSTQAVLGLRGDFRAPDSNIRFVPELSAGFGDDDTSYTVMGSGILPISLGQQNPVTPYAGLGVGFITRSGFSGLNLVFNLAVGAEYRLEQGTVFVEYNSLDFFDVSRVVTGVRIGF